MIQVLLSTTLNKWFSTNLLVLNFDKTQYIQFKTTNTPEIPINISYNNKYIVNCMETKFLGITIDSVLSWKKHIQDLKVKLCKATYAIMTLKPFVSPESLKRIYFAYFHSIMTYGIIFWGTSSHSGDIFRLQKRVIRIITNSKKRDSCRNLFKDLNILPFYSQLIFSLLIFVIDNIELFKTNTDLLSINIRSKNNLKLPQARLSSYQKGVYYMGIKTYNLLPSSLKDLVNKKKQFKLALKRYLLEKSYYSLRELFDG